MFCFDPHTGDTLDYFVVFVVDPNGIDVAGGSIPADWRSVRASGLEQYTQYTVEVYSVGVLGTVSGRSPMTCGASGSI